MRPRYSDGNAQKSRDNGARNEAFGTEERGWKKKR